LFKLGLIKEAKMISPKNWRLGMAGESGDVAKQTVSSQRLSYFSSLGFGYIVAY
jgi:hypothetical protein